MSKIAYSDGSNFHYITPDMIDAFPSQEIDCPGYAERVYYLIGAFDASAWGNYRITANVASRHSGNGIVSFAFGNDTNSLTRANMYGQIYYFGTTNQVIDVEMFQIYGSADGSKYYLFTKSWDYNDCKLKVLASNTGALSRSYAMDSIDTNTYGTLICNTSINLASCAETEYSISVGSSQPTDSQCKLWIVP